MILYLDTNVLVYSIGANDDLRRATQIRATLGVRTPDALHLAATAEAQADIYLTGDRRLKAYKGVAVADVLRDKPGTTRRTSG